MTALLLFLVGCRQPAETYHKAIDKLQITSELTEVEMIAGQCSQAINNFITTDEVYSSYQEKMNHLNYQKISSDIHKMKELLAGLQKDINQLKPTEDNLIVANKGLIAALAGYQTLIKKMESAFIISCDLDQDYYEVQTLNKQILELSFSGEPASDDYKMALSEFLTKNKDILNFIDLAEVEGLFNTDSIDQKQLEELISDAKLCNEKFKLIHTYNKTDQETHELIIKMYDNIINMYVYVLDNKPTIEWMNGYASFSDYYKEQKEEIQSQLTIWQEVLEQ